MFSPAALTAAVTRRLAEVLAVPGPAAPVLAATREVLILWEHLTRRFEAAHPLPTPIACAPGCSFCCYNQVELTPLEALVLGDFLIARVPAGKLPLLLGALKEEKARLQALRPEELARRRREFPCPLLVGEHCSVYPVRPLMCRAMHSLDQEHCRRSLASPELLPDRYYQHRHDFALALSRGLREAAAQAGLQAGVLGLTAALADVLATPDALTSWLAGERIFGVWDP